jgi:hypothetical protein
MIGGIREPESLAPLVSLFALADVARAEPEVDAIVRGSLLPEEAWAQINHLSRASRFRRHAAEHLNRYGDRTGEELKLETKALRDCGAAGIWYRPNRRVRGKPS